MKTILAYSAALIAGLLFPFVLLSQPHPPDAKSIFGILQSYNPLVVSIETNLKQLKNSTEGETWQPAVFKVLMATAWRCNSTFR